MSDPVKNVEIEDVLSSIRKLVADDSRVAPAIPGKVPDRLVLTPAQRVQDAPKPERFATVPVSEVETAAKQTPVRKQEFPHELPIEAVPRDARLADFGKVEGAFPDLESLQSPYVLDDATADPEMGVVQSTARLELGRLIEQEVAAALKDMPASDDLTDGPGGDPSDELEWSTPDKDFVDDGFMAVGSPESEMDEADTPPVAEKLRLEDEVVSHAEDMPDVDLHHVHVPPPQTLEDKVAALGRLVARDTNEFEEERDDPDADDLTSMAEPMTWSEAASVDTVEDEPAPAEQLVSNVVRSETAWQASDDASDQYEDLQPEPELEPEAWAETPAEAEIALAPPPPVQQPSLQLDEDMLRDLVGDIVRQELQGALGERITRNVRKLVRREIHRMLISQEME